MGFYTDSTFMPETSIGYLVRRSHQLSVQALEPIFAAAGMTATQWSALASIRVQRLSTCAAVARDIAYDKGATTRLLDSLEERGWINRRRDHGDRRVVHVMLTPAGETAAMAVRDAVVAQWNEWLTDWNDKDIMDLIRLLQRLRGTLTQATDEGAAA
ncbi:MarR family winged helix-turn-helix transcriptional regulator [Sphingomonas sp. MMO-176]|jgi:DNA-binding MarR family transcriptional regulator|nr:MarR family transcriptional regulator [Sphingomonas sp. FARSPH]MCB8829307.1 MarR family winged helix-turn-helix transcriptional regulator [Escherichia coli]